MRQGNDGQVGARVGQVGQRATGMDVHECHFTRESLCGQVVAQHRCLGICIGFGGLVGRCCKNQHMLGRKKWGEVVFVHMRLVV